MQVEIRIKKGTPIGPLTSALKCFLDDFHSSSRGHVVPSKLFGEITRKLVAFISVFCEFFDFLDVHYFLSEFNELAFKQSIAINEYIYMYIIYISVAE